MLRYKLYLFMIIQQDTSGPAFEGPPRSIFSRGVSNSQALVVEPDSDQIVTVLNSRREIFYPVGNLPDLRWLFLKKASDSNSQASKTDNSTFLTFRFLYFSPCSKNKFDLPFCFVRAYIHSYLAIITVKNH